MSGFLRQYKSQKVPKQLFSIVLRAPLIQQSETLIWIGLKMLKFLLFSGLLALAWAKPQYNRQDERYAQILRYDNVNHGDGTYNYNYETSNGIAAEESGYLKGRGSDNEVQTVQGSYQYYSPEGILVRVVYTADENGFQPQGDHLPTPPPIPPAIQKSLDIIYANIRQQQQNPNYRPDSGQYKPSGQNQPPRRY